MIDVKSPIIQSGLSFQIILREPENQEIFDVDNDELTVGYVSDYLNKALKVISVKVIESELYGLIVRGTNIIGWTRLNHSIKLISKPIDTIRVDLRHFSTPQINRELGFKVDYNLLFKEKNFSSRALYLIEGEVLEAVFNKGTFTGFVPTKDIDRAILINKKVSIEESTVFYQDSTLQKSIDLSLDEEQFDFNNVSIDMVFLKAESVRVIIKKKKYWISLNDLEDKSIIKDLEVKQYENYNELTLEQLDMITNFQEERKESKSAIVRLINENISLQKTNKKEEKAQYERLYMNLKNSKLGKIQTKYWSWRNRRKS
ncbi:hypothetical protein MUA27_10130 [Mammaliicoccus sciuri]|uniref:hypothetical protein n=1 Tax=Mammaliicoccus sciuri TaxID=1296 RepID=UPI000BBEA301|nr:hypothetical protein [Mammaliicoccus sciuri]MCD8882524.1 hypothetical protein [Mammaliicoccus sciuri]MEB7782126.1 hypothetical protein [Mammaliicoccus sciuri]PCM42236.1 hypothetical protein CPU09_03645 [Mammaliicoccus sciuri]UXU77228.1 hypothetical protein MUA27_10130 [Mammaliicoccus sciuri]